MSVVSLEALTWTIPGICFLFSYNRLRDVESLEFSGWPFVFFIVLIGAITELPLRYVFGISNHVTVILLASIIAFLIPFIIKYLFNPFVKKLEEDENFFMTSALWSIIYFFFPLENRDKFIKNCVEYEGEPVLVTTKEPLMIFQKDRKSNIIESTLFFCILIEFPYVATKITDSQVIRILPLFSGYKYIVKEDNEQKIQWTKKYEIEEDSAGMIIPRSEILNFSPYIESEHKDLVFYSVKCAL